MCTYTFRINSANFKTQENIHMKKAGFCTLGCKVNQYESEAMITLFKQSGYEIGDFGEKCDIYVINTCTVTGTGDRKSRQMIHRALAHNPDAIIVAAGCYSQVSPNEIEKIDGVNLIIGTDARKNIVELVEDYINSGKDGCEVVVGDIMKQRSFEDLWISSYEHKTRAFVKIEEGCTEFCSYCIIPYARGPVRSRPIKSIEKEVKSLAENGYKEIVLTGIHLASYGRDLRDEKLIDVIETVSAADGIERIRLGSVEPRLLTDEFIGIIAKMPKVCDHFHISLQSGCDKTLKAMNRKYTCAQYAESVEKLRTAYKNPAITTDIITGFPGESIEDFNESFEFLKKIKFSEAHIFPYSERKGTKAAAMDGKVDKAERERRAKIMIEQAAKQHENYMNSFVGCRTDVLFERNIGGNTYEGHMTNYIRVRAQSDEDISHMIKKVTVNSADKKYLLGEIAEL